MKGVIGKQRKGKVAGRGYTKAKGKPFVREDIEQHN